MAEKKTEKSAGKKKVKPSSGRAKTAKSRKKTLAPAKDSLVSGGGKNKITLPAFGLAEDILGAASAELGVRSAESAGQDDSTGILPANTTVDAGPELHLITFKVDREEYGVDISEVREIIRVGQITAVPNAPSHVKGVINIRGRVVPVLSLSKRLDVAEGPLTKNSRIVVVDANARALGLLVDSVSHVLRLPAAQIDPPPSEAEQARAYVKGIGKIDSRLIMIMDLEKVLKKEAQRDTPL
ncbi:MAG TPA: chemotaxis protein CheW [Nitrospiraceae bacterium]|jgi:purine-binding chemotaxis protein CheW|nr:chemotaxis protein CheW [Nitrospiraceae bacterium]